MQQSYKKLFFTIFILFLLVVIWQEYYGNRLDPTIITDKLDLGPACQVPLKISSEDHNSNNIPDALDLVQGARQEVEIGTVYDASFYSGGYPPEGKGCCTDVIWRAFKAAGYDLKTMVDEDIKNYPETYGVTGTRPDPDIDFRRVKNLQVFFKRHGQELITEVKPGEVENLKQWQPGDIVVFGDPLEHIGIISNQRQKSGVPLVIHNGGPRASEANALQLWPSKIIYHFRFFNEESTI